MTRVLPCLFLALSASSVQAASRARFGGTLRFASAHPIEEEDPLLADTPWEATILSLVARSICSLSAEGKLIDELAESISYPTPTLVNVKLRAPLRRGEAGQLTADDLARSWSRASGDAAPSPYRSLLYPLKFENKRPAIGIIGPSEVQLSLEHPWPDFDATLCHPALAVWDRESGGIGPFSRSKTPGALRTNPWYPRGGPFVDRVVYVSQSERTIARNRGLGKLDVSMDHTGPGPIVGGLFTTYLAFDQRKTGGEFRRAFSTAIDRADLAKFFAAPAEPAYGLLSNALAPEQKSPSSVSSGSRDRQDLALLYDAALTEQRRVAERIQVKLHDLGYRISLQPLSRRNLRQRWARQDFDLAIFSVLLPPRPAAALAVVLDLAGQAELMRAELPPLGQISDAGTRDAKARERAFKLTAQVPLIPLYSQSLHVYGKATLEGLRFDAYGLPLLDDAFLRSP